MATAISAALAVVGGALLLGATIGPDPEDPAKFKAPKRIKAGGKFLGEGRLYPSPAIHDMNGDGKPDVVLGDLFGNVTFAARINDKGVPVLSAEEKVKNDQGKLLKFENW